MAKLVTRQEARNRRMRFQAFAGMFDFLGTVFGIVIILACLVLLRSLVSWVISDSQSTFDTLFEILDKAIIKPA